MNVTPFPTERARPPKDSRLVWLQHEPGKPLLFRVLWTEPGKGGFDPVDYALPRHEAAELAAQIARERGCRPIDPAVQRLLAREVRP
jgi:hypothetical protein